MDLSKLTTNLQTPRNEYPTISRNSSYLFPNPIFHYSNNPLLHGIRLCCFLFASFLIKLADEFGDVVDFDLLFSKLGISEIVQTGRAFGEQNVSACLLDDLA